MIPNRDCFPHIFSQLKFNKGAEIGVQAGDFAQVIVDNWAGQLYLVDCWEYQSTGYVDATNAPTNQQEALYRKVIDRFSSYNRVHIIKGYSVEVANNIEELDFIYLDANHSKEAVTEDLKAWYPKVRKGGILCGHDYKDGNFPWGKFGVKSAVDEFAADLSARIYQTDEEHPSWLFFKP